MRDTYRRAALISELIDRMNQKGSWAGETHVQKAVFMLQDLFGVPTEYQFQIYKYGPFSFDLRHDLVEYRAKGLLKLTPNPYPYGPSLHPAELSETMRSRFPKMLSKWSGAVDFVTDYLGNKKVSQLERLSTALFLLREDGLEVDDLHIAKRLHELKPHVSLEDAERAAEEARKLISSSS